MTECITVTTGSRLHFGLLVAGPSDRRSYGGVGLMIDQPRFSLTVRKANAGGIQASSATGLRIARLIQTLGQNTEELDIVVHEEIPPHAGLGSGTQLALAVGTALSRLGNEDVAIEELSQRAERGTRSIIGTVGFECGGLISHSASLQEHLAVPEIIRQVFPAAWRFVLVTPPGDVGLSGDSERRVFQEMPAMSGQQLQSLGDLQQTLTASACAGDFDLFSQSLTTFGRSVGEYFAPFQAGVFASGRMAELSDVLKGQGVQGVGQTSWGPTLFAVCRNESEAAALAEQIQRWPDYADCRVRMVAGKNCGAEVVSDENNS